jgi:hypothetical protein
MLKAYVYLTLLTENARFIGCKALLNIPGILLTAKNGYNSEGGWNLEAEIA